MLPRGQGSTSGLVEIEIGEDCDDCRSDTGGRSDAASLASV